MRIEAGTCTGVGQILKGQSILYLTNSEICSYIKQQEPAQFPFSQFSNLFSLRFKSFKIFFDLVPFWNTSDFCNHWQEALPLIPLVK